MALFETKAHFALHEPTAVFSEQLLFLPYELRTEMTWIDFSVTSNPLGTPKSFLNAMHSSLVDGDLSFTPDREARSLRAALAKRYEMSSDSFLCGGAVSEMIRSAAQAFAPCAVGVPAPFPSEYLLALTNAGHEVVELGSPHAFVTPDASTARRSNLAFDAALLANPSYPTSRLLPRATLENYLETCKWVIVDESLIELTFGGESMVPLTQRYQNLVVIRSFVHTFAMPGVPISYCIAHPDTIAQMRFFFDGSNISMFAEVLADVAASEDEHVENTREMLDTEIPWMQCMLNLIPGIHIFPAEANFVMCSYEKGDATDLAIADTTELVLRLQLAGFLVRKLEGMPGVSGSKYFCVAVRTREENEKLIKVLREIILCRS
ncbi:MAG: aminotransferase class I/II-fold pyridoxal phosphate-dependent enzyme [Coriobacteriaceae bacterium]|nr:aminotransferase class I/II-fold pyridoxal phosphate-dependent enzyme [Coriobacteriaceae bacterium]